MIRSLGFTLACVLVAACARPVYLVRHTEKYLDQGRDPDLTHQGHARAVALSESIPADLDAIYVTTLRRTWQTAGPTAARTGAAIEALDPRDTAGLVARVERADGPILIVGHSNTLPEILGALGVEEAPVMDEVAYGTLYVLRRRGKNVRLKARRFGD